MKAWGINVRTWLTDYLNACAAAGNCVPADLKPFLPWSMDAERLAKMRGLPGWRLLCACYKAANWICVGRTAGRGKKKCPTWQPILPAKDIWLYPSPRTSASRSAISLAQPYPRLAQSLPITSGSARPGQPASSTTGSPNIYELPV